MATKTLVIGASENPARYAFQAVKALVENNHEVLALGKRKGQVHQIDIKTEMPSTTEIDTVSLYINPTIQKAYENFLMDLNPRRVIFNPGTENPELANKLEKSGIQCISACTLVLLATDQY